MYRYAVTAGYFETVGIPLRRGRLLDVHDTKDAPWVAVISESLAKRRYPNEDPIGKRFHLGGKLDSPKFPLDSWVNFYRRDDYSSVAYFYLDRPTTDLPRLQRAQERIANLRY